MKGLPGLVSPEWRHEFLDSVVDVELNEVGEVFHPSGNLNQLRDVLVHAHL